MLRKIVSGIPICFLCLGIISCKSPEEPEEPKSHYRYNVEVIYSDVAEGESNFPLFLYYGLWDLWGSFNSGDMIMTEIGDHKARCYLPEVLILTEDSTVKHWISVIDPNKEPWCKRGENIVVEGAYDLEIKSGMGGTYLSFKMSKK